MTTIEAFRDPSGYDHHMGQVAPIHVGSAATRDEAVDMVLAATVGHYGHVGQVRSGGLTEHVYRMEPRMHASIVRDPDPLARGKIRTVDVVLPDAHECDEIVRRHRGVIGETPSGYHSWPETVQYDIPERVTSGGWRAVVVGARGTGNGGDLVLLPTDARTFAIADGAGALDHIERMCDEDDFALDLIEVARRGDHDLQAHRERSCPHYRDNQGLCHSCGIELEEA